MGIDAREAAGPVQRGLPVKNMTSRGGGTRCCPPSTTSVVAGDAGRIGEIQRGGGNILRAATRGPAALRDARLETRPASVGRTAA